MANSTDKLSRDRNFCVIMAGGVGSRFWPESRNSRPKQFLDFFGTGQSLIQMTVNRFRELVPVENILIVTNVLYRDMILEQLPELKPEQILCEPARRNTAPCVAYAVSHISGIMGRRLGVKSIADVKGTKTQKAEKVGEEIAKIALDKGISQVVFDRNGFLYHGRVKALADAARKGGLKF